ncbi:hypothetical protein AWB78_07927 [Caballeronia calidae]|uniref:Uncharacterized protein n=1 Tax=Caballeronia calidae TaxID=1777139 RepID=A0A158EHL7_9BURK|nr:hypothetical protein AWB78_07927 [Caballeronia calidae]
MFVVDPGQQAKKCRDGLGCLQVREHSPGVDWRIHFWHFGCVVIKLLIAKDCNQQTNVLFGDSQLAIRCPWGGHVRLFRESLRPGSAAG